MRQRDRLMPAEATPFTMYFWKMMKTMMMGNASSAPAAIVRPMPVRYWERKTGRPTGIVTRSGSVIEMKGHKKSFQLCMKTRMAREDKADLDRGAAMRKHIRSQPQPSIFAASKRAGGRPSKKFLRMITAKGAAIAGTINEKRVFSKPALWNCV